jgi:hypothetical protein
VKVIVFFVVLAIVVSIISRAVDSGRSYDPGGPGAQQAELCGSGPMC